jgi:glutamyl-tRNA reductase
MGELSPQERKRLEAMTEAMVKKILHAPISRLRQEAGTPKAAQYAATARSLFGLDGISSYQNMEFPNGD